MPPVNDSPAPVALFSPSLLAGGAERIVVNLARGLQAQGQRVEIVLAKAAGEYLSQVPPGIEVLDLGAKRTLTSLPALARYIYKRRPERIIAFQDHANIVALWARRLAGTKTPVIATVHTTWSRLLPTADLKTRALARMVKSAYETADAVVVVSEQAADDLSVTLGLSRTSLKVIYNPIVGDDLFERGLEPLEHPWFAPGAPPLVLAIGRLVKEKDFGTLIRAFAEVRKSAPCRLMILGEGTERSELERLALSLSVSSDVALPGFVHNPYRYLRRSALFVLSSVWEGLPTVLVEALALGVPIVSTDCPSGPREILCDGRYGRLVPVGDWRVLSRAINDAFGSGRQIDGTAAVARFRIERASHDYMTVLTMANEMARAATTYA